MGLEKYGGSNPGPGVQPGAVLPLLDQGVAEELRHKNVLGGAVFQQVQLGNHPPVPILEPLHRALDAVLLPENGLHLLHHALHAVEHEGGLRQEVGVGVENLVEEVAAVVGGQLGMPDQAVDLPDADGSGLAAAVVNAEALLEIQGVVFDLIPDEEHELLLPQQLAHVEALQVRAEGLPVRIVEIDMVLPAHILASAHVVVEILQLVLGIDLRCENGLLQVMEEIPAHHGVVDVDVLPEPGLPDMEGDKAPGAEGVEPDGQVSEGGEILSEEIGVALKELAVALIAGAQRLLVGLVERFGHDSQAVLPAEAPAVEIQEAGIGRLVAPPRLEQVQRRLHLLRRGLALMDCQGIGFAGVFIAPQLHHAPRDFDCSHITVLSAGKRGRAAARPLCRSPGRNSL